MTRCSSASRFRPHRASTRYLRSTRASSRHSTSTSRFEVQEVELSGDLGFIRTRSQGTITPKGQTPEGGEGNREIFVLKKRDGEWKYFRYIFNAEV